MHLNLEINGLSSIVKRITPLHTKEKVVDTLQKFLKKKVTRNGRSGS
jgi:hypothetical protein